MQTVNFETIIVFYVKLLKFSIFCFTSVFLRNRN